MTYSHPGRDRPTVLLGSAWTAYYDRAVDAIPSDELDLAYHVARDLAIVLGAERHRRSAIHHPDGHTLTAGHAVGTDGPVASDRRQPSDQVVALAVVVATSCDEAYGYGHLPTPLTIAAAVLVAGYHRDPGE